MKEFARFVFEQEFCDKERLYLMGASMGGYGTWQLAMSMPEIFAAIAPICGGGMAWNCERLKDVPVWAFHGGKDSVVSVEESKRLVDAVNNNGGNALLTIYPENGHDARTDTYDSYEVFKWLLTHKNVISQEFSDKYNDSNLYG